MTDCRRSGSGMGMAREMHSVGVMSEQDTEQRESMPPAEALQSSEFTRPIETALPLRIGPYRVLRRLGVGGMGVVYEGLNETIERRVAIKMLHARYSHDPDTAMRFINEARAVNRIDHPGVVQISDHGRLEDGSAYIVMELLQGESLSTRIHRHSALPIGECIDLASQIAESLAAAHERNIIHRDLKPDNIMVVPDRQMPSGERTKILDFGIAKLSRPDGERAQVKTQTSAMLGTPFYMSPEQAQGSGKVDARTDVYSLGIILYEMLSGKPPFDGEGIGELIVKHMNAEPPLLSERAPNSPAELNELVYRLLQKDRDKRPTMHQLSELLDGLREKYPRQRRRLSIGMPVLGTPALTDEPARPSTLGRANGQAQARSRQRVFIAGAALATLSLGVVLSSQQLRARRANTSWQPASAEHTGHAAPVVVPSSPSVPPVPPTLPTPLTKPVPAPESVIMSGTPPQILDVPQRPIASGSAKSVSGHASMLAENRPKKPARGAAKKSRPTKVKDVRPHIED